MGAWVKTEFIFGLFVYVRMTALSLDRVEKNPPKELTDYFIKHNLPLPKPIFSALQSYRKPSAASRLNRIISWFCLRLNIQTKKMWVDDNVIAELLYSTEQLVTLFSADKPENVKTVHNKLRLRLSRLEYNLSKSLPKTLHKKGCAIEHLNQAAHLELQSFHDIVGNNWLNS
ncbi:MAG: hypothetical protein D3909_05805 [Candidatus Electrothrix sp. ATG1]|nr:hypothetical protein [Candidatus Electrothrix sp. ATG1]MCI5207224.1 hypothetical protein [Candidatus Electrothrix sp. ATG2]